MGRVGGAGRGQRKDGIGGEWVVGGWVGGVTPREKGGPASLAYLRQAQSKNREWGDHHRVSASAHPIKSCGR